MSKYTYDREKLNYAQVGKNLRHKFIRAFTFLLATLFIAILFNVFYALFFDTPHERQLKQENTSLIKDYEFLKKRYAQIDTVLLNLREIDRNIYRMIFETEPVNRTGPAFTDPEAGYYFRFAEMGNVDLIKETKAQLNTIYSEIEIIAREYHNLYTSIHNKQEMLLCIPAIQPIENQELIRAASGFGYRIHPFYKISKFHSGMDFTAPIGTPVIATGDGIIEELSNTRRGSGNTIIINHGFGYKTVYSHLDKFNVRAKQKVKRGELIGWVGNTGLSVAPHLHYEVLLNEKPVNPVNYFFLELTPEKYDKMIELSVKSGQSFD
jgi:hypothetical protein